MTLVEFLFSVARNITDGDTNELNKLRERAINETSTYHTDQKGLKGLYAKINNNWMFQLGLVFVAPFLTSYLLKKKNEMLNSSPGYSDEWDEEEDDLDDYNEWLRQKNETSF